MAKRKRRDDGRVSVTHREEEVEVQEVVVDRERDPASPDGLRRDEGPEEAAPAEEIPWGLEVNQEVTLRVCNRCRSSRYRLYRTTPQGDGDPGRQEYRVCLGCGNKYKVFNPFFRR